MSASRVPQKSRQFEGMKKLRMGYVPWVILMLGLVASFSLWRSAERNAVEVRQAEFDFRVRDVTDKIRERMSHYEQVLHAVRAFFVYQHEVEHSEYQGFVSALKVSEQYPGIQGISFASLVQGNQKKNHERAIRKDGIPAYAIRPAGERESYAPVDYIEPYSENNKRVIGYDNLNSPVRKAILERARDQDQAVLSEKLELIQDEGGDKKSGVLMFLPVYKADAIHETLAERRANITGWLAASFRISDLMAGIFGRDAIELDVELFDEGEMSAKNLIFDSDGHAGHNLKHMFSTSVQTEIGGRRWQLLVSSLPEFESGIDHSRARLTAISGLLLSLLLAGFAALLQRDRVRVMQTAANAADELEKRRGLQAALQDNETRWKLALEAAGHGVWDYDVRTGEVKYSDSYLSMLGYSREEYPTSEEGWTRLIHPDDLQRVLLANEENLKGKTRFFISEYRILCKDGSWKWIVSRGTVVERGEDGKPLRMIGTHTDIAERRAMEEALRVSQEQLRLFINNAPVRIAMYDRGMNYLACSALWAEAHGISADSLIGQHNYAVHPDVSEKWKESHRKALAGETIRNDGEAWQRADGSKIWVRWMITPWKDGQGEIGGIIIFSEDITERIQAETSLRDSEERYRSIFDNAQDFIFTLDSSNKFTSATNFFSHATGYSQAEIIGAHISKFLTPENMEKSQRMTALKLQGVSKVTQYDIEVLAKDGHLIPFELNTSLIFKDGKLEGVQGIGRDISERRQHEQALRESEEKYRGLFETMGDFAYGSNLEGNFTAVSDSLLSATGYSREELIGAPFAKLLTEESLKLARQMSAAKLSGETQTTCYELTIVAKDGYEIPIEIVSELTYRNGKPIGVQGTGRDITRRKHADAALRESERNYRELMEQASEAITIYDQNMRCVDVNCASLDMLGYSREEYLTFGMRDLVHPDDLTRLGRPDEQAKLKLMLEGKTSIVGERRMRHKDGRYIPVQVSAKRLSDGRILSFKKDITEWRNREEVLKAANEKAEAASRAKSEFLANMSHEIRTPMNSVIGMTRLAMIHETNSGQRSYLEKIMESGEHLLDIIDDILDFSKIDAGKLQLEIVDLDVVAVMQSLANLLADKATEKGLHYIVNIDVEVPRYLRGDALRLRQVLLNFTDNAIKFTAQGEVAISVRKIGESESGCSLCFEVRDTGIGMSDSDLSELFHSFQQADGSITRRYGGTGLGLVISKNLIELMGGQLGVESEPGKGSKFWFEMQLEQGEEGAPSSNAMFAIDPGLALQVIRGKNVLLVENNLFNQQVAREFLENAAVVVVVANNGAEALDLLQKGRFDAVLMDLQMPVMGGLEATVRIRGNPVLAGLPVIAMTANALKVERERCLDIGMNDFITKPVRPETLYAVLARCLSGGVPSTADVEWQATVTGASAPATLIDLPMLEEMMGGQRDKARDFALKFVSSTKADMLMIDEALMRQDMAALREVAHHIKSPAGMVGANGFVELCRKLEDKQNIPAQAREIVLQMHSVLAGIEASLNKEFS